MGGGRPDAGPLPFDLPVSVSPTERGRFVPQQLRFPGDVRDRLTVGSDRDGRLTPHSAARFAEHLALKLSDLFRINAAIGGCFVSGFGSTGAGGIAVDEAWSCSLAVADDGGSGT